MNIPMPLREWVDIEPTDDEVSYEIDLDELLCFDGVDISWRRK